jgi:hypothetical protein
MSAGETMLPEGEAGLPEAGEHRPSGEAAARPDLGGRLRSWRRRWPVIALWLLGAVAGFTAYLMLARTRAVNSDGSSNALQAWDMLHGNLLLHGWSLTDVSFYTTELPQYMLVEFVHGLGQDVVHIAAAMTYTLAVVLAALLAKGKATGREALIRVAIAAGIMLAPQLSSGVNVLISSPDHIGTSVPMMVLWLILDRAYRPDRPRWYLPVLASLLLGWAEVADTLVLYIGVLPLALVCAVRVVRSVLVGKQPLAAQRYDLAFVVGPLIAAALAALTLHLIHAAGGFYSPSPIFQFASLGTIIHRHLRLTAEGLLLLGGADFFGLHRGVSTALIALHLVGVLLAAAGVVLAARHFLHATYRFSPSATPQAQDNTPANGHAPARDGAPANGHAPARDSAPAMDGAQAKDRGQPPGQSQSRGRDQDIVVQVLLVAIVINVVAYALSTHAASLPAAREISPVLPFSAALAGRMLAPRLAAFSLAGSRLAGSRLAGSRLAGSRLAAPRSTAPRPAATRIGRIALPVLALVLLGYVVGLVHEAVQPSVPAQNQRLTTWLAAHHLHGGLSGYWQSNVVTLTSADNVQIRAVSSVRDRLVRGVLESDSTWFNPAHHYANFVVFAPGAPGYTGFHAPQATVATFGPPARTYHVGRDTVLVWNYNLLTRLR